MSDFGGLLEKEILAAAALCPRVDRRPVTGGRPRPGHPGPRDRQTTLLAARVPTFAPGSSPSCITRMSMSSDAAYAKAFPSTVDEASLYLHGAKRSAAGVLSNCAISIALWHGFDQGSGAKAIGHPAQKRRRAVPEIERSLRIPIFCRRNGVAAGARFRGGRGPSRQHLSRTAFGATSDRASLPVRRYPNPASLGSSELDVDCDRFAAVPPTEVLQATGKIFECGVLPQQTTAGRRRTLPSPGFAAPHR